MIYDQDTRETGRIRRDVANGADVTMVLKSRLAIEEKLSV